MLPHEVTRVGAPPDAAGTRRARNTRRRGKLDRCKLVSHRFDRLRRRTDESGPL
jgi:hypothetical protein